jgi:hypothetical protein
MKEPINLREWRVSRGRLFTCGRPGRATFGTERRQIDNSTVDEWVSGLPGAETIYIVSLLGHKPRGYSEFEYYPFRSSKESGEKPTFQEWLHEHYGRRFVVHEFPTIDRTGIAPEVLTAAKRCVIELLGRDHTVLVVDSAGAERTARVCEAVAAKRITPQNV